MQGHTPSSVEKEDSLPQGGRDTMGLIIFILAIFAGKIFTSLAQIQVSTNSNLQIVHLSGSHLSKVCATGIAPFGVVPVELVRYFHVSFS